MGFAIDEGLNTEADAIDAGLASAARVALGDLARGALDRDLGIDSTDEFARNSSEELAIRSGSSRLGVPPPR